MNIPGYLKKQRIGFTADHMRAEALGTTKLVVFGLAAATVVIIVIIAAEQRWHQPFGEIIRIPLRGFFAWVDAWR